MQKKKRPFKALVSLVLVLSILFSVSSIHASAVAVDFHLDDDTTFHLYSEQSQVQEMEKDNKYCPGGGYQKATITHSNEAFTIGLSNEMLIEAVNEYFPAAKNLAIKSEKLTEQSLQDIIGENVSFASNAGKLSVLVEWADSIYVVIGTNNDDTVSLLSKTRSELKVQKADFFNSVFKYAISGGVHLDVKNVSQRDTGLTYGCEFTSMYQMVKYVLGDSAPDIHTFASNMKYSTNGWFDTGYIGNPYTTDAWTTAPGPQLKPLKSYIGSSVDLSHTSLSRIRAYLTAGVPVAVWFNGFVAAGKSYNYNNGQTHCCLLVGYDSNGFYLNDPDTSPASSGEYVWYPTSKINTWMKNWAYSWDGNGFWAISY